MCNAHCVAFFSNYTVPTTKVIIAIRQHQYQNLYRNESVRSIRARSVTPLELKNNNHAVFTGYYVHGTTQFFFAGLQCYLWQSEFIPPSIVFASLYHQGQEMISLL